MHHGLRIVSTCPESCAVDARRYREIVVEQARRAEGAGHHGLLVLADNRLLDPWVVAQLILEATERLRPVVTLRPLDTHPYAAARKIHSLVSLYDRPIDLVLAAGASRGDLVALDDRTSHDLRYRRLEEYGGVVKRLLSAVEPIRHEGESYRLYQPTALAPLPPDRIPNLFIASSSDAGRRAAERLGAHGIVPLLPGQAFRDGDGIRVGIVAREDAACATRIAAQRFPERPGQRLEQRLEMKWTDSRWKRDLDEAAADAPAPYWLRPFEHRHAQTGYLVGDHRTVGRALLPAFEAGCRWLFLDTPGSDEDLRHAHTAIQRAWSRARSPLALTS